MGLGCSSVVDCWPSMFEVLGLVPRTEKKEKKKYEICYFLGKLGTDPSLESMLSQNSEQVVLVLRHLWDCTVIHRLHFSRQTDFQACYGLDVPCSSRVWRCWEL